MKPQHLLSVVAAAVLLGCSPTENRNTSHGELTPDPAVVTNLQEIVEVRQRIAESHHLLVQAGRALDDGTAEIALAEARMELARERHQREDVLAELKKIITVHEGRLVRAKATLDRTSTAQLDEIRVGLLRAQIHLAREQAKPQH